MKQEPKAKIKLVFQLSPEALEEFSRLIDSGSQLFSSTYRVVAEIRHIQAVRSQRRAAEAANAIVLGARAAQQLGSALLKLVNRRSGNAGPDLE